MADLESCLTAYNLLCKIRENDAYSNLLVPASLKAGNFSTREKAFITDCVYGTLRWQGFADAVISAACKRDKSKISADVLDILRLGTYRTLFTSEKTYAVVNSSVEIAKKRTGRGSAGFVNAVMRKIALRSRKEWESLLTSRIAKNCTDKRLAVRASHPEWIVEELRKSYEKAGYDWEKIRKTREKSELGQVSADSSGKSVAGGSVADEPVAAVPIAADMTSAVPISADPIAAMLEADNAAPSVTLCARPGLAEPDEILENMPKNVLCERGKYSPYALKIKKGGVNAIEAVKKGLAGVEDEGSQIAALALVNAPVEVLVNVPVNAPVSVPVNAPIEVSEKAAGISIKAAKIEASESSKALKISEKWLDMCAGPGGKTALLGACAAQRNATLTANEPSEHRAKLVRENCSALPAGTLEKVYERDGRELGRMFPETFDRILVDAPCSGLGSLRRRAEARWRKNRSDIKQLAEIQRGLLLSAAGAVRKGGVIAYVTCSPALAETREIVDYALAERSDLQRLDAAAVIRGFAPDIPLPDSGGDVQLFEHIHDTDQMFVALLRKK